MEDDLFRETQPDGELGQPPRKPPTAVAVATPGPGPEHESPAKRLQSTWFGQMLSRTLDFVDVLGDVVADVLHLRRR